MIAPTRSHQPPLLRLTLPLVALGLLGCPDTPEGGATTDDGATASTTENAPASASETSETTTSTTTDATTTTATTDATTTTTTTAATTEEPPVCGDGVIDPGEECDDGGESPECNDDCTPALCGDGKVNQAAGEACDPGPIESAECNADCSPTLCGDGYINHAAGEACDDGNDDPFDGCDACAHRYSIFVTSVIYKGNLNGVFPADARCQHLATEAGLSGRFRAWLSDAEHSPASRFEATEYVGDFMLLDGTVVAKGWEQLTSGQLEVPIALDEHGQPQEWMNIWSNTTIHGTSKGAADCDGWTKLSFSHRGHYGVTGVADAPWTDADETFCNSDQRLYCVQVEPKKTN